MLTNKELKLMERRDWLALRKQGIGGSDVAAIIGVSPWKTAYALYMEKTEDIEITDEDNERLAWGRRLEAPIREWYCETTGREVVVPDLMHSKDHPFMLGTLDGIAGDRGLEIKTAHHAAGWGEPGTDQIPTYYLTQVHHYMIVSNLPVFDVAVSIAGSPPVLYEVKADRETHDLLIKAEEQFWKRVQQLEPPPTLSYSDIVSKFGKAAASGSKVAEEEVIATLAELKETRSSLARLTQVEEELKGRIIAVLGADYDTLTSPEGKPLVTYRMVSEQSIFDTTRFKQEQPAVYAQYLKIRQCGRRFCLK